MANLRNEFEFRSALLTALGQEHTEAEAKNEDTWRRKMLDGLGVEYDQNDVNQFGLFREKLIEGVTSKSEGGGSESSDFSTARVTVATTVRLGSTYHLEYRSPMSENLLSAIINDDGSLSTNYDDQIVTVNSPNIYNILFTKNGYVSIFFVSAGPIIVEGNGEVLTETIEGTDVTYVRAYGECTITKTTTEQ